MIRHTLLAAAGAMALALAPSTHAQEAFPTKPIRIVVPFTAGGIVDSIARTIG